MDSNFIQISYNNRHYIVNKDDSLKSLLSHEELLRLPLDVWKELFERKDGACYFKLMLPVLEAVIREYDKSPNVNSFYYNNKEYWLDKATRVGLQSLASYGSDNMSLVLGDEIVKLSIDKIKEFLAQLEIYAGKCYINTARHLLAIKKLRTVEDIIKYDYTSGYPDKITLNE
jgi:hypothetical protein|uniref:DUF4376 domain-containing protein n=1 Tax=Podoviridae sp. ct8Lf7 TaxID=2827723 RepID=A0A8S5S0G5_9CAUD|nr:MAG TPA: protein of unknown function (DUF4376) [Podoviridae sp. ct8Lf7]